MMKYFVCVIMVSMMACEEGGKEALTQETALNKKTIIEDLKIDNRVLLFLDELSKKIPEIPHLASDTFSLGKDTTWITHEVITPYESDIDSINSNFVEIKQHQYGTGYVGDNYYYYYLLDAEKTTLLIVEESHGCDLISNHGYSLRQDIMEGLGLYEEPLSLLSEEEIKKRFGKKIEKMYEIGITKLLGLPLTKQYAEFDEYYFSSKIWVFQKRNNGWENITHEAMPRNFKAKLSDAIPFAEVYTIDSFNLAYDSLRAEGIFMDIDFRKINTKKYWGTLQKMYGFIKPSEDNEMNVPVWIPIDRNIVELRFSNIYSLVFQWDGSKMIFDISSKPPIWENVNPCFSAIAYNNVPTTITLKGMIDNKIPIQMKLLAKHKISPDYDFFLSMKVEEFLIEKKQVMDKTTTHSGRLCDNEFGAGFYNSDDEKKVRKNYSFKGHLINEKCRIEGVWNYEEYEYGYYQARKTQKKPFYLEIE